MEAINVEFPDPALPLSQYCVDESASSNHRGKLGHIGFSGSFAFFEVSALSRSKNQSNVLGSGGEMSFSRAWKSGKYRLSTNCLLRPDSLIVRIFCATSSSLRSMRSLVLLPFSTWGIKSWIASLTSCRKALRRRSRSVSRLSPSFKACRIATPCLSSERNPPSEILRLRLAVSLRWVSP